MKLLFVAIPIILAIISNIIFTNRQQYLKNRERNPYLPPGWVIGTVWVILFGLLGYTTYLVKDNMYLVTLIVLIILYCLSYPAITNFDPTTTKTHLMNIGSFLFATILIGSLYIEKEFNAIYFVIPLWLWTSYVNVVELPTTFKNCLIFYSQRCNKCKLKGRNGSPTNRIDNDVSNTYT